VYANHVKTWNTIKEGREERLNIADDRYRLEDADIKIKKLEAEIERLLSIIRSIGVANDPSLQQLPVLRPEPADPRVPSEQPW